MSQSRTRKLNMTGEGKGRPAPPRARTAAPAGDCAARRNNTQLPPQQQTKHINNIPKSLRYDLENALLGLCDVWFEEIKPYLLANNIKLHVHEGMSAELLRAAGAQRECAHLDPGAASDRQQRACASCAGSCSTRPTASRAPCRRRPQVSAPRPHSQITKLNPKSNSETSPAQTYPQRKRTPRLCQIQNWSRLETAQSSQYQNRTSSLLTDYRKKVISKHKETQTSPQTLDSWTQTQPLVPWTKPVRAGRVATATIKQAAYSSASRETYHKTRSIQSKTLFTDDLINTITENYDDSLTVLYQSPLASEYPSSVMNFIDSNENHRRKRPVKKVPWR